MALDKAFPEDLPRLTSLPHSPLLVSQVTQVHGASSALEDPLPWSTQAQQRETSGPPAQPLDDVCSFPEANRQTGSGCGVQMHPVRPEVCREENRLNGLNSQAWCNPVIGQPEAKPCPSRIMRLFSNQKHCGNPASERTSNHGSGINPQTWSGLSGLKVMGSFKKLRTSVFQGIQSRGNAMTAKQDADYSVTTNEDAECVDVSNGQQPQQLYKEGWQVNGMCGGELGVGICSGASDDDEDEYGNDEGLQRNTHFSRSIRRAYGAGRIALLDLGWNPQSTNLPPKSPKTSAPCPSPVRPRPVSTVLASSELHLAGEMDGKALSRLSKSADNLHVSKAPFKRKTASAFLANPQQQDLEPELDPEPDTTERGRTPNMKRTTSASSVDSRERSSGRWRSPSRPRVQMQRLVGSLTDLTFRRCPSSPLSPQQGPLSLISQLHDDYSRRIPCVPPPDRQRRPSPARPRAVSEREGAGQRVTAVVTVERTPSIPPVPFDSQDLTELVHAHKTTVELHSLATQPANQCVAPLTSSPQSGARALGDTPAENSEPVEDHRRGTNFFLQPCPQPVVDQRENQQENQQNQQVRHC